MDMNEYTEKAAKELSMKIDTWFMAQLKPKPRWIPEKLWFWVVGRFVELTTFADIPSELEL